MSGGRNEYGTLGQGSGDNKYMQREFQTMDYDVENIEFEGSDMHMNQAMGWDSEGRLYGWGYNSDKGLGLPNNDEYHKPTLVEAFNEKYTARYVQVGREFSMVKAIHK